MTSTMALRMQPLAIAENLGGLLAEKEDQMGPFELWATQEETERTGSVYTAKGDEFTDAIILGLRILKIAGAEELVNDFVDQIDSYPEMPVLYTKGIGRKLVFGYPWVKESHRLLFDAFCKGYTNMRAALRKGV